MRRRGRKTIARKVERLDARPCLSPEEEAALLEYLRHEEDEPVRMPPPGTPFTLIEVEPPRGVNLSDALYRTAEEMRARGRPCAAVRRTTFLDRLDAAIRAYPDWSRAELARMDAVVADVLAWCRDGTGGPDCFAAWLWETYLKDALEAQEATR